MSLEATAGGGTEQDLSGSSDLDVNDTGSGLGSETGESDAADQSIEAASQGDEAAEEQLISDTEFEELIQRNKGDALSVRKDMQRAFTKKTQDLAARRKENESQLAQAKEALDFTNALRHNPEAVIRNLARQVGIEIPGATKSQVAAETKDEIFSELSEVLGEEGARQAMPALSKLVEKIASKSVEPVRKMVEQQAAREAEVLSKAAIDNFTEKHPDWKRHESAMFELAKKIEPKGMSEDEYLETLHTLASHKQTVATKVKERIDRINKSARDAEPSQRTTSPGKVATSPGRKLSFKEASEMAFRGEKIER